MMKNLKLVTLLFIAFYILSCNKKVASTVRGWWTIDTLNFGSYGDIRHCVSSIITFDKDGICKLQSTGNNCKGIESFNENGVWNIIFTDTVPVLINIGTDNRIFNGIHEVYFYRDNKEGLLKMAWVSDSLYMICRKGMYNIDLHEKEVNELIKLTNEEWEKKTK
jgi:hypothetical protein